MPSVEERETMLKGKNGTADSEMQNAVLNVPLRLTDPWPICADPEVGAVFCETCRVAASWETRKRFSRHFRMHHTLSNEKIEKLWKWVEEVKKVLSKKEHDEELRGMYRNGTRGSIEIPEIQALRWHWGQVCPEEDCKRVLKAGEGLRTHLRVFHKQRTCTRKARDAQVVRCQTLTEDRCGRKYFRIRPQDVPADRKSDVSSCCRNQSIQQEENINQSKSSKTVTEMDKLAHTVAIFREEHSITTETAGDSDDKFVNAFVSMSGIKRKLQLYGVKIWEAAELRRCPADGDDEHLHFCTVKASSTIAAMLELAKTCFYERNAPNSLRFDLGTAGKEKKKHAFKFLSTCPKAKGTLSRYARAAASIVYVASRLVLKSEDYPGIRLRESTVSSIKAYASYCIQKRNELQPDDPILQRLMTDMLCEAFFEEVHFGNESGHIFCDVLVMSLCVIQVKKGEEARISTATSVSALLSGVMYTVSCTAVLRILEYFPVPLTGKEVHNRLRRSLAENEYVGLMYLIELRSLCSSLRPFEVPIISYSKCHHRGHGICGILRGMELSTLQVGEVVRNLQNEIRKIMFEELLLCRSLPGGSREKWESQLDAIVEDAENNTPGFSALTHPANELFMQECKSWTSSVLRMHDSSMTPAFFVLKCIFVLKKLYAAAHLAGGGTGRSTEIGSYLVRNTPTCRRSIYFLPKEVMLLAFYDKRRQVLEGTSRVITRHLDEETSFLLKSFLVLLRPVAVAELKNRAGTNSEVSDVLDRLTLSAWNMKEMPAVLAKEWSCAGLNMRFSDVRQSFTGLWKLICDSEKSVDLTKKVALWNGAGMSCGEDQDESSFESLNNIHKAGFEQSAHSARRAYISYAHMHLNADGELSLAYRKDDIEVNRAVSHKWQLYCGLRGGYKLGKRRLSKMYVETQMSEDDRSYRRGLELESRLKRTREEDEIMEVRLVPKPATGNNGKSTIEEVDCEKELSGLMPDEIQDPDADSGEKERTKTSREEPVPMFRREEIAEVRKESREIYVGAQISKCISANVEVDTTKMNLEVDVMFENVRREPQPNKTSFNSLNALKRVVGANATWKSAAQKTALELVWEKKTDVLVVIGTGGGKTAVPVASILFEPGFTVWITPLRALRLETQSRLEKAGARVHTLLSLDLSMSDKYGNVFLVGPESTVHPEFESSIRTLRTHNVLNRVVIDEAHLLPTSNNYRQCMRSVWTTSNLGSVCRVVMLTATCPSSITQDVLQYCGSSEETCSIVRADPCRPNLKYEIEHLRNGTDKALEDRVVAAVSQTTNGTKEYKRIIVYCLTTASVERLYAVLQEHFRSLERGSRRVGVGYYHGKLSVREGDAMLKPWYEKGNEVKAFIMVATEAFGCGIDAPDVRLVLFAGAFRTCLDYAQQSGRGGRDEKFARILTLYNRAHLLKVTSDCDDERERNARLGTPTAFLADDTTCRRRKIEEFLGGSAEGDISCILRKRNTPSTELCDICLRRQTESRSETYVETQILQKTSPVREVKNSLCHITPRKMPHVSVPNDQCIREGRNQQARIVREIDSAVNNYRKLGEISAEICFLCLARYSLKFDLTALSASRILTLKREAASCDGRRHLYQRCLRCRGTSGHSAITCPNLESILSPSGASPRSSFMCAGCRLRSIRGRPVHRGGGEVGRRCFLSSLTLFSFAVFWDPDKWNIVRAKNGPYSSWRSSVSRPYESIDNEFKLFANWLLEDDLTVGPGIVQFTNYLVEALRLSIFF